MKTLKLGLLSFVTCLLLGVCVILLSPPQAHSTDDPCNYSCGYQTFCPGPVGSCTPGSGYVPWNRCYVTWPIACQDPGDNVYNCCVFIGCGFPC